MQYVCGECVAGSGHAIRSSVNNDDFEKECSLCRSIYHEKLFVVVEEIEKARKFRKVSDKRSKPAATLNSF